MKFMLFITGSMIILLTACNGVFNTDNVKPFIPGIYHVAWRTPYSQSWDTIVLAPLVINGSEGFSIMRRTQVNFINAAKNRAPEFTIVKWTGSYNAGNKTVVVNSNGRVMAFDVQKREMKMGVVSYKKL